MEPVKTCATCRHSIVGRRDPMDWWKRRLCAHPGLVDRVEGRPIHEAESARGREGPCGLVGVLWEGADTAGIDEAIEASRRTEDRRSLLELKPSKLLVYPDQLQAARQLLDPVDEALATEPQPGEWRQMGVVSARIPDTLLPRKPAKRAKRKASKEGDE
jgi:hypothetical protein